RKSARRTASWRPMRAAGKWWWWFTARKAGAWASWRELMATTERYDALVVGSGQGGKLLAWDLARSGRGTAVVERQWIGGSCPNINCMPSKNEVWSANVAYLARHGAEFGTMIDRISIDMMKVRQRKRDMVERQVEAHLHAYKDSGAELIMGS